jgi:exosortase A
MRGRANNATRMQAGSGWGFAGLSIAVLLLLVLWMYRETVLYVSAFWNRWDSGESYAHGYLTLAICLYLVYRQRHTLARLTPCVSATALAAVAASSLIWLVAAVTDVLMVQTIALLLLILSVLWATLGNQVIRHLVIPVLILIFAIPIWSPLPPILQEVTADATFRIVRLIGMTVFRQEQLLIFPAGQLSVDEDCSGVSYLLPALVLGMLYAYLNYQAFWSRLLVVVIAGGAAILANILRVVVVVQQAYVTDMQTPLVREHFNLGWLLFGGLVFVLLLVDYGISRYTVSVRTGGQLDGGEAVGTGCAYSFLRQLGILVATGALLASGPAIAWWAQNQSETVQVAEVTMPAGAVGWSGPSVSPDTWMPVFHGAVAGKSAYQKDGYELYLYIGYYPIQKQGSELIFYRNRISNEDQWRTMHLHGHTVTIDGQTVLEQEVRSVSGRQRLVWYWYRVSGFNTTNQYKAKGLQLLGMMTGEPQASVVIVAVDIDDVDRTRQAMRDFISSMRPSLSRVADGKF